MKIKKVPSSIVPPDYAIELLCKTKVTSETSTLPELVPRTERDLKVRSITNKLFRLPIDNKHLSDFRAIFKILLTLISWEISELNVLDVTRRKLTLSIFLEASFLQRVNLQTENWIQMTVGNASID